MPVQSWASNFAFEVSDYNLQTFVHGIMDPRQKLQNDKPVRLVALITLAIFFFFFFLITCLPLFPFWIDEWLLIDNLKFKTSAQLWHALEHTQQFPRVYLQLIKSFSAACDYSYTSLRLPSFLAHSFGLILLYRLSRRIFRDDHLSRFCWVMIYVSFSTSIHYFVQLKQYTMEMALSLVGIWQLLELIRIETKKSSQRTWLLLCASFALCPFFSYTYPIVVAPVYLLVAIRSIKSAQWRIATWIPLFIGILAVGLFYLLDVRQVLADEGMQDFWKDLLMKTFSVKTFFTNTYMMFSNLGSGDLFGNIMGVLGLAAFLYSTYRTVKTILSAKDEKELLIYYSCLLLWIVLALFIAGKLPLGTFRLNSFVVPALGLMIMHMLQQLKEHRRWRFVTTTISLVVFLGAIGNVYVTMAELAGDEHAKKLRIYQACDRAILEARQKNLPVFVTSGIAFPFDDRWPGDWILKTHPRYKTYEPLHVYALPAVNGAEEFIRRRSPSTKAAMVLDGDSLRIIHL